MWCPYYVRENGEELEVLGVRSEITYQVRQAVINDKPEAKG